MKKIILTIVLFFGIVAYSNSKSQNPPKETKVIRKIVKEYSHGVLISDEIIIYSYENNLVSEITTTSPNGDVLDVTKVKYENGKLKQMDLEVFPSKHRIKTYISNIYNYTDDLITSIESAQNGIKNMNFFYYNSLKQLEKKVLIRDGKTIEEEKYEYYSNGNISKTKNLSLGNKNSTDYNKTYDNKKNPFDLIFPPAYLKIYTIPQNNVISCRLGIYHYTYEYEYNSNDYPIKITTKGLGGKKTITTIEYE